MNKFDFFLAAMKAGEYRRRAWVISAFSLIAEGPEDWKFDPYPYRIVQTRTGHFFVNPDDTQNLLPIENTDPNQPPFYLHDQIRLVRANDIPNVYEERIDTSYGNLLFNYVGLIWPFHDKIPFMEGRVGAEQIEDLILPRLVDDPPEGENPQLGEPRQANIFVREYLKFADAMFYMAGFTQLCVPATTEKTMTAPPGVVEFKQQLLDENKDRLHDPAVIAKIDKQLVQYDANYLKGDRGEGFLISKKSRENVRRKLFLMHGAETGLEERVEVDLIPNSLSQGWDISKFPAMNDSLRAGSFNRGAQTMLGGEAVKWLLRASSNMTVTQEDCGSRLGNYVDLSESNKKRHMGRHVILHNGHEELTPDNVGKYLGTTVMFRSPMFCRLEKTDFCKACVGARLAANPTALSSSISDYGSAFLAIFMSAAHAKALQVARMDFQSAIQ